LFDRASARSHVESSSLNGRRTSARATPFGERDRPAAHAILLEAHGGERRRRLVGQKEAVSKD
jgi:hypothetical protein